MFIYIKSILRFAVIALDKFYSLELPTVTLCLILIAGIVFIVFFFLVFISWHLTLCFDKLLNFLFVATELSLEIDKPIFIPNVLRRLQEAGMKGYKARKKSYNITTKGFGETISYEKNVLHNFDVYHTHQNYVREFKNTIHSHKSNRNYMLNIAWMYFDI